MTIRGSRYGWHALKKKHAKRRKIKPHACYLRRNSVLSTLGYRSYAEYLRSDDWKKVRSDYLASNRVCILCKRPAEQVHHTSYDERTLLGLAPHRLAALCDHCHGMIEFHDGTQKRKIQQVNRLLMAKVQKNKVGRQWYREWLRGEIATLAAELSAAWTKHHKERRRMDRKQWDKVAARLDRKQHKLRCLERQFDSLER